MDTSKYQPARLIPVTGIKGEQDQERRATSALLAAFVGVPEFARTVLKLVGAPVGRIQTFIEPEFKTETKTIRPDGLITVERAGKTWAALVEVKTSKNRLGTDQINSYLELARVNKLDGVITISNEMVGFSGEHPTQGIDGRKLKSTFLAHFSWVRLVTLAIVQSEFTIVSDPDQAWILRELIRFLQHEASGANEFDDMGMHWVGVREAVSDGTIMASDKRLPEILHNFDGLMTYAAFRLSARLGVTSERVVTRLAKTDPKKYRSNELATFLQSWSLQGVIRIPGAASDLSVVADLKAGESVCSLSISAPQEGKNATRLSWLVKQLKDAPDSVRVDVYTKHARSVDASALLGHIRESPQRALPDASREVSHFVVSLSTKLGSKRGSGKGTFISSVIDGIENFYASVLQPLKDWQGKAPKLSEVITDLLPEISE